MEIVDPRIDPALVPPGSVARVIAEHQDDYKDLPSVCTPALVLDGKLVRPPYVITRWSPTNAERAAIVRGEDIFVTLLSHGPINPLFVTIGPTDWR